MYLMLLIILYYNKNETDLKQYCVGVISLYELL